jgi:thiamine biosynthesis protein ThiI
MRSVVIHYAELALKGRNRSWFISVLVRSIRRALAGEDVRQVRALIGRIVVTLGPAAEWREVRDRLERLPGIGNFALAEHVPADVDAIGAAIIAAVAGRSAESFRVTARRADKRFPIASPDLERLIGGLVQQATGWRVNLSAPAVVIRIEILTDDAFFFFERVAGAGGLPVGTGGKVLALLSGGIDSPVAAWRLIRRGCRTYFVHFHSYPILARTSQDKARALVETLTRSQLSARLYLVPFGAIQQQVLLAVPAPLRVIVYRRLMLRLADRIAERCGAQALVTGDAVGQVASQTIDNLAVVGRASTMPLLRPLVGMDKEEITADAQRIGTYGISIVPDEDCCTLFTPRFPATRASAAAVDAAERGLDLPVLCAAALAHLEVADFRFPMLRSAVLGRGEARA